MKKIFFLTTVIVGLFAAACNKSSSNSTEDFTSLKTTVLADFTTNIALAGYKDLNDSSTAFNNAIIALNAGATEANLAKARTTWKNLRTVWEQCEGFLFGPVEDNDYDPNMDTWPTDYTQLDSVLSSSNTLEVSEIQNFTLSLRGYHPLEYIIFGDHGNRTAASLTTRQKKYMVSLSTDIMNTCHALYQSWVSSGGNFALQVSSAGSGSTQYAKKLEAYQAIVGALTDICEEVGGGKMKEPYDAQDASLVESPYSGNSVADFRNNIVGLQNVYLGKYKVDGRGLNDLVAAKNKSLDNTLQSQITAAINSFNNITLPYEQAIISQRVQCQQTMTALETLKETLETQLSPFLVQYIQD